MVIVVVIGAKERREIGSSHGVPFKLPAEEDQAFQRMIFSGDRLLHHITCGACGEKFVHVKKF